METDAKHCPTAHQPPASVRTKHFRMSALKCLLLSTAVGGLLQCNSKHLAFLASADLNYLHVSRGTVSLKLVGYWLKNYLLAPMCTIFPLFAGSVLLWSYGKTNTLSEHYSMVSVRFPSTSTSESLLTQSLFMSNIPLPSTPAASTEIALLLPFHEEARCETRGLSRYLCTYSFHGLHQ